MPRSPQGYPLLVQAGSSEDGKGLAARYAEAVFTAQQTLGDAQAFYTDLKARAAADMPAIAIVTNARRDAVDAAASARKVIAGRIFDP